MAKMGLDTEKISALPVVDGQPVGGVVSGCVVTAAMTCTHRLPSDHKERMRLAWSQKKKCGACGMLVCAAAWAQCFGEDDCPQNWGDLT